MSPAAKRVVEDGIQCAVPVARRIRFALSEDQMEREVASLRRELDESRAALGLQTARCRQLVAAYSARLRAGNALRDHQLTLVLRALVALEARLRREQKAIRAQLGQRDAIIHQQQVEISRLRAQAQATTPSHAPASRTSSGTATTPSQLIVVNHTCGQDSTCESGVEQQQPSDDSGRRGPSSRKSHETVVDTLRHHEAALRVLELVGPPQGQPGPATSLMPLLNGETACIVEPPADFIEDHDVLTEALTPPPDVVASYNDMNRECLELATMAASLRQDKTVCFQDNPVLECVNLILLRDQEDFPDEHRQDRRARGRSRRSVDESPPPPPASEPPAWYNNVNNNNNKDASKVRLTPPALPPKPPRLVGQRPPAPTRASKSPTPTSPTSPVPRTPTALPPPPSRSTTSTVCSTSDQDDANAALRRNFEEFNLDDCDIEGLGDGDAAATAVSVGDDGRPRPEGDGAESGKMNGLNHDIVALPALPALPAQPLLATPTPTPVPVPVEVQAEVQALGTLAQQLAQLATQPNANLANYDTFLEATGLSNKSILTPSRMLSNHRSVLKPKDVKHRSRVKAQQGTLGTLDRCAPTPAPTPTVKYWTEPFL